jgi:hypothetical protein
MGEARRKRSATQKLIEQHPHCCFCGGLRPAVTREHMPPKALFDGAHRPDKLVMPACDECNHGTSTADLTASIISRWGYDMDEQQHHDHRRLVAQARKQAPDLVNEWISMNATDKAKARARLEEFGVPVPPGAGLAAIGPLSIRQLNLFASKTVLGLYFEHFREFVPNQGRICGFWRSKEDFARDGIPKELLEMMRRYGTLEQGRWNAREIFEYRYEINEKDGLFMCLARLRGGLFTCGFAVKDAAMLTEDSGPDDWVIPSDLLGMINDPRFEKRL